MFKILAPISYWVFLIFFGIFSMSAFRNSVGNVTEIIALLDNDVYNKVEIAENYNLLKERWGEWEVIGGEGSIGIVKFINIKKAMFSGVMITHLTLAILSLFLSLFLGKLLFLKLSQLYSDENQSMIDLATLDTQTEIKTLKKNKEWF